MGGNFIFRRALTINGGSIEGNGSIDVNNIGMTNSGLLNPRLAGNTEFGRLTINSNYTETNSASINIQLGGNIAGTNFDQVDINGTATFDGKLNVSLLNNFTPTLGSTFDVLTYDSLNASSNLDFTGLSINSTLKFLPQWFNNKLTLKVVENSSTNLAIAATNANQTEGNSGSKAFTFTVNRSGNTTGVNSVNWAVIGSGTNPANATDFVGGVLPTGTVNFAAAEISKVITINIQGDTTIEPSENFTVTLSNPTSGATITTPSAIGTIQNDDISNIFTGTTGNDTLVGTTGADTMRGGLGNDTYYVDNTGDRVIESANSGTDTVRARINYTLTSNVENLILEGTGNINGTGNSLNNSITGNSGNNILNGGTGADTMRGGLGNDTYYVDNTGDRVIEVLNEGTDTVRSTITYTLPNHVENLILEGTANINGTGNTLNNNITGNSGSNILNGGGGNDTLNGGTGSDRMVGGNGNDTYYVDNTGDRVIENANSGTDTVRARINYTLTSNVENLILEGTGNINGTGSSLNNSITGNSGNNILNGGTGADTMRGGLGNDTYYVDNTGDRVIESANSGTDTVRARISYTLTSNVENLILEGTGGNINGTGNSLNNSITGNSAANILNGGAGNDILTGGAGKDTLTGGLGSDRFVYKTLSDSLLANFDVIKDFNANANNDLFLVSTARSRFTNVGAVATLDNTGISNKLTTANFGANSVAQFSFGTRSFVAINNATAGFSQNTDAIIEITGLTGTLGLTNFVIV